MTSELRWLDQALQRVAPGEESGMESMWGVQGASLDQQGMGQRAQVQLQHGWGKGLAPGPELTHSPCHRGYRVHVWGSCGSLVKAITLTP